MHHFWCCRTLEADTRESDFSMAPSDHSETKVSVFTPWDETHYVVLDVPEGRELYYLDHDYELHTIWTRQGVQLEKLEWQRRDDGTLLCQTHHQIGPFGPRYEYPGLEPFGPEAIGQVLHQRPFVVSKRSRSCSLATASPLWSSH